ncbi:MAG: hypothetical protein ACTHMS_01560 [Jatrophihabitans sp.]|uniref:hypothetical protein n=1 Tax=Jatrophihabitans sp. TaxID=1932789 RepID=UPI003F81884A
MGPRDFDPVALGNAECDAWIGYYRRDWRAVLTASVRMVRIGFGMNRPRTLLGAWYVLRANQAWAPVPDNDPARAREYMRRFYALVQRDGGLALDPVEAARREVEWWRVHRAHQRQSQYGEDELADCLVELYGYVYRAEPDAVRPAAVHRVVAMRHSDAWVAGGCRMTDPLLVSEREELVASYTALLAAVRR